MKELVKWLIRVEEMAGSFYDRAAQFFREETELFNFLNRLAEDEAWHFHIMGSAAELLSVGQSGIESAVSIDEKIKSRVEEPFLKGEEKIASGKLDKDALLRGIVSAEYSEWNDLFLYVINSLKAKSKQFQYAAAKIQDHKDKIEAFIESLPQKSQYLNAIHRLPLIWEKNILVVDDEPAILELLEALLGKMGVVRSARNGQEAFEKTAANYFDLIITDINMPILDGIEFYKKAVLEEPAIWQRFLFFSGAPSSQQLAFLTENGLAVITKPATLDEIRENAEATFTKSKSEKEQ
jgi:CheY-like chemotaxis protein